MMSALVVPVGRRGPLGLPFRRVTRKRMFEKRLDRLYTASFQGPSDLSVVCEGPHRPSAAAFSSRRGRSGLPSTPGSPTWHVRDKGGRKCQRTKGFHPDRTGRRYTAEKHGRADTVRAEGHSDPFCLYEIIRAY